MIARSVFFLIQVTNVEVSRVSLDQILVRHHGYSAKLNADTAEGSARTLRASLRIPAPELTAALRAMLERGHGVEALASFVVANVVPNPVYLAGLALLRLWRQGKLARDL